MAGSKKPKLDKEPYKGVRDFYPEDQFISRYLFDVARSVAESFGYMEYNASILEPTELYEAKSGEEIVKEQTYSFEDRGGRKVTLRPEMTPTVARLIAKKRRDLSFPLRWYSIGNMFRYERPQKGRVREHLQLNVDLFGAGGMEADSEMIEIAHQIMTALGAKESDFEIRVSNRKILYAILVDCLGITEEKSTELMKLTDRRDKIDKKEFEKEVKLVLGEHAEKFLNVIESKDVEGVRACMPTHLGNAEMLEETNHLLELLKSRGITNVQFDASLVRGFDYYTGMVFEIFDTNPDNNRSLFGGGRFDKILEIFGEPEMPAVGFGMGDVRVTEFLKGRELVPAFVSSTDLYVCLLGKEYAPFAQKTARTLRAQGINVEVGLSEKKVPDQIKTADKKSIPFIVCVGEKEEDGDPFVVKELATGEEFTLGVEEIAPFIKERK